MSPRLSKYSLLRFPGFCFAGVSKNPLYYYRIDQVLGLKIRKVTASLINRFVPKNQFTIEWRFLLRQADRVDNEAARTMLITAAMVTTSSGGAYENHSR